MSDTQKIFTWVQKTFAELNNICKALEEYLAQMLEKIFAGVQKTKRGEKYLQGIFGSNVREYICMDKMFETIFARL